MTDISEEQARKAISALSTCVNVLDRYYPKGRYLRDRKGWAVMLALKTMEELEESIKGENRETDCDI